MTKLGEQVTGDIAWARIEGFSATGEQIVDAIQGLTVGTAAEVVSIPYLRASQSHLLIGLSSPEADMILKPGGGSTEDTFDADQPYRALSIWNAQWVGQQFSASLEIAVDFHTRVIDSVEQFAKQLQGKLANISTAEQ